MYNVIQKKIFENIQIPFKNNNLFNIISEISLLKIDYVKRYVYLNNSDVG